MKGAWKTHPLMPKEHNAVLIGFMLQKFVEVEVDKLLFKQMYRVYDKCLRVDFICKADATYLPKGKVE
jgi:hypothetical protein